MTDHRVELGRRDFLFVSVTAAGGMAIGLSLPGCRVGPRGAGPASLGDLIRIEPDGRIVFRAPGPEMGQQLTTSQAMLVAEELEVSPEALEIERLSLMLRRLEDGSVGWASVPQFAGGSNGLRQTWQLLLEAGAEARDRLVRAAAARMGVPRGECHAKDARVIHGPSGRSLTYGEVAHAAALLEPDPELGLEPRRAYTILGRPQRSLDNEKVVTGREVYGMDVELPGLKHAVIERAPRFGVRVKGYDDSAAAKVAGVIGCVPIEGAEPPHYDDTIRADGVAVVAVSLQAAMRGRERLQIQWTDGPHASESDADFDRQAREKMERAAPIELTSPEAYSRAIADGVIARQHGDVEKAFREAASRFRRTYEIAFGAHATMEPQNCTAHVREDGCELHVPTQLPRRVAAAVAKYLGIDILKVEVLTTRSGGGFGRRLRTDYALEAAQVSRAIQAPVKVTWSREDDIRYDYFRPRARFEMNAAFDRDNALVGWHVREASTPLEKHPQELAMGKPWSEIEVDPYYAEIGVFAGEELYFDNFPAHEVFVPNLRMDHFYVHSGIARHAWRAPGLLALEFANQSFLDEVAHELGEDPLEFLLRLIGPPKQYAFALDWVPDHENGRLSEVLRRAAEKAEWGRYRGCRGHGQGIAAAYNWGTYAAHVVDVHVGERGELTVLKVTSAVDCGPVINPDGVRKQVEGGINDALSAALHQEITVRDGRVEQSNFHDYRMMRIDESPREIEVHMIQGGREDDLRGMGEAPLPPLAPALCNAIFAASGQRVRRLPIGTQLAAETTRRG